MAKRDKIEAYIYVTIADACHRAEQKDKQWRKDPNHFLIDYADQILHYLHSQGVVIKVDRESAICDCCRGTGLIGGAGINDCCPDCNGTGKIYCAGYVAVEPLIKEGNEN